MSGIGRFMSKNRRSKYFNDRAEKKLEDETQRKDNAHAAKPKQTAGLLQSLFAQEDHQPKSTPEEQEQKIRILKKRLAKAGITTFSEGDVRYVLNAGYAQGDVEKASDLLMLLEDSQEGIIKEYNPNIKLLGAVNRSGVTCYLDALLFAMFARLGSFEAILYNTFDDEPRKHLAMLLRLWVNTLRVGKLITEDITKSLQEALAKCGWEEAAQLCQQDASEAFTFITEKLELPLLTLKMDIFHTGKEEATDDHKFVNERLLEVAIPEDIPDGKVITLEDCLETYFNNRIEVRRYLERRGTLRSLRSRPSVDSAKINALHVESAEVDETPPASPISPLRQDSGFVPSPSRPVHSRRRAPSIVQERYLPEKGEIGDCSLPNGSGRPRTGSIRKEIMMPAWQFFSLIPWYTDNAPSNDAQVAAHFSSKRPVLGICLKRYSFLPNGTATRRDTHVDVPLEIGLPHFIQDDSLQENGPVFGNFKLSLQSIVCHRGNSVDSGHYISLIRGQAPNAESPAKGDLSSSPDLRPHDSWMRFDDLQSERITHIDIERVLQEESPYLLFYQVQPIEHEPGNTIEEESPPSYSSIDQGSGNTGLSKSHPDNQSSAENENSTTRSSCDRTPSETTGQRQSMTGERRASTVLTEESFGSIKPDHAANSISNPNDDSFTNPSSFNTSRRTSKISQSGSRSRRSSVVGDKRLSATLSRLMGNTSKDKIEPSTGNFERKSDNVPVLVEPPKPEPEKDATKARLKREQKEKRKSQQVILQQDPRKGKRHADKPDRECTIM